MLVTPSASVKVKVPSVTVVAPVSCFSVPVDVVTSSAAVEPFVRTALPTRSLVASAVLSKA